MLDKEYLSSPLYATLVGRRVRVRFLPVWSLCIRMYAKFR